MSHGVLPSIHGDLSGMFSALVRDMQPIARRWGRSVFFDFRGPSFEVGSSMDMLMAALRRLIEERLKALDGGGMFFSVEVLPHGSDAASLVVQLAESEAQAGEQALQLIDSASEAAVWQMQETSLLPAAQALRDTVGRLGGLFLTGHLPECGRVTRIDMSFDHVQVQEDITLAQPHGQWAWVTGLDELKAQALMRRMERLGWRTKSLATLRQAGEQLSLAQSAVPAMMVVASELIADQAALETLKRHALNGVSILRVSEVDGRSALNAGDFYWPLSPRELFDVSKRALAQRNKELIPSSFPDPGAPRLRALVVDDNLINQLLCSEILKLFGFEVDVANHGGEAVDYCRQAAPTLVIMDIDMPVMDGFEASSQIRKLQRDRQLSHIPIIAATADDSDDYKQRASAAGMDGFLEKPLDFELMRLEICRVLGRPSGNLIAA